MKHRWPNEDRERAANAKRELDSFLLSCRELPGFQDAASLLALKEIGSRNDIDEMLNYIEHDYSQIAARIRMEEDERWLRTADALFAEASIQSSSSLTASNAAIAIGTASGTPIADAWIANALREKDFRKRILKGLEAAFKGVPTFLGEGERVEEARETLVQARSAWTDKINRTLREVRMSLQWTPMMYLVEPIHALIAPLFETAPKEALELLDTMPSPADIVLVTELVGLRTNSYENWARAVRLAPTAWNENGWVGCQQQQSSGLVLPILLWNAEEHLSGMTKDAEGIASPSDVADVIRNRSDGALTSWHWCASLLERADRDDRDGRARPEDGGWRTAQALAAEDGWDQLDPGNGQDSLLLEAAQRMVPEGDIARSKPRIGELLPTTPEEFIDLAKTGDLCWAAVGLVGALGPMFEGRAPYGTVTRILATGLLGQEGPMRLHDLWSSALVIRDLASGGVIGDLKDHRKPDDLLHLIIALGLGAMEMIKGGSEGDIQGLGDCLNMMLNEIEPWDILGHEPLHSHFQKLRN